MNNLTVLMVLHNEAEYAKLSLQSIRMFADVENLSVVLVDNHSEDTLREWASLQEDITYVYMDEGQLPFGQVINKVCSALRIEGDVLIMDGHYMLTPHALSRLQAMLYEEEINGAVGGVSNSFFLPHQEKKDIGDYEAAVQWASGNHTARQGKQVLGLQPEIIMVKASAISRIGAFDEELVSQQYVMKDYCYRMVLDDWKMQVCGESLFWDMRGEELHNVVIKSEASMLEKKWGMHYFQHMPNHHLINLIDKDREAAISVLEIGCDCGATLLEIRNRYPNAAVYGSEINEKAARVASHIAKVQVNNIEEQNLDFPPCTFDYIIFGDVLEHLHDPLRTIQYCKNLLKKDGAVIASIPNLMHISVMEDLLQGNFTYTEMGLLDKTHIHLFTFNEITRLFEAGGYEIEHMDSLISSYSEEQGILIDKLLELQSGASRFMYETFQFAVCARRKE